MSKWKTTACVIEKLLVHESYIERDKKTYKPILLIKGRQYKEIALKIAKLFY